MSHVSHFEISDKSQMLPEKMKFKVIQTGKITTTEQIRSEEEMEKDFFGEGNSSSVFQYPIILNLNYFFRLALEIKMVKKLSKGKSSSFEDVFCLIK